MYTIIIFSIQYILQDQRDHPMRAAWPSYFHGLVEYSRSNTLKNIRYLGFGTQGKPLKTVKMKIREFVHTFPHLLNHIIHRLWWENTLPIQWHDEAAFPSLINNCSFVLAKGLRIINQYHIFPNKILYNLPNQTHEWIGQVSHSWNPAPLLWHIFRHPNQFQIPLERTNSIRRPVQFQHQKGQTVRNN